MPDHPEDDPTGVRRLLSDLPDPTPPSPDLLARIGRSLDEIDDEAPLRFDSSTSHRRPRLPVLTAALVLGVALVAIGAGLLPLLTPRLHQVQAALHLDGAATDAESATFTSVETEGPSAPAPSAPGETIVVATGTTYHRGSLTDQVDHLRRTHEDDRAGISGASPSSPPLPGGLSLEAVRTCLNSLIGHGRELVDVAAFGSHPALIVVREDTGAATVTVLPTTCADGGTDTPLAGPYRVH